MWSSDCRRECANGSGCGIRRSESSFLRRHFTDFASRAAQPSDYGPGDVGCVDWDAVDLNPGVGEQRSRLSGLDCKHHIRGWSPCCDSKGATEARTVAAKRTSEPAGVCRRIERRQQRAEAQHDSVRGKRRAYAQEPMSEP
jgi:hypothetical protein